MHELWEKVTDYGWQVLATFVASWILYKQKLRRAEYKALQDDVEKLKQEHIALANTLDNVKKNQEIIRNEVQETNRDVKKLLSMSANSKKQRWWF